jgi:hypothetical protein
MIARAPTTVAGPLRPVERLQRFNLGELTFEQLQNTEGFSGVGGLLEWYVKCLECFMDSASIKFTKQDAEALLAEFINGKILGDLLKDLHVRDKAKIKEMLESQNRTMIAKNSAVFLPSETQAAAAASTIPQQRLAEFFRENDSIALRDLKTVPYFIALHGKFLETKTTTMEKLSANFEQIDTPTKQEQFTSVNLLEFLRNIDEYIHLNANDILKLYSLAYDLNREAVEEAKELRPRVVDTNNSFVKRWLENPFWDWRNNVNREWDQRFDRFVKIGARSLNIHLMKDIEWIKSQSRGKRRLGWALLPFAIAAAIPTFAATGIFYALAKFSYELINVFALPIKAWKSVYDRYQQEKDLRIHRYPLATIGQALFETVFSLLKLVGLGGVVSTALFTGGATIAASAIAGVATGEIAGTVTVAAMGTAATLLGTPASAEAVMGTTTPLVLSMPPVPTTPALQEIGPAYFQYNEFPRPPSIYLSPSNASMGASRLPNFGLVTPTHTTRQSAPPPPESPSYYAGDQTIGMIIAKCIGQFLQPAGESSIPLTNDQKIAAVNELWVVYRMLKPSNSSVISQVDLAQKIADLISKPQCPQPNNIATSMKVVAGLVLELISPPPQNVSTPTKNGASESEISSFLKTPLSKILADRGWLQSQKLGFPSPVSSFK